MIALLAGPGPSRCGSRRHASRAGRWCRRVPVPRASRRQHVASARIRVRRRGTTCRPRCTRAVPQGVKEVHAMLYSSDRKFSLLAAALLVLPGSLAAQATITGRVTSEGGAPVAAASVFFEGLSIGAQTTEEGRYSILVPAARATGQAATLTVRSIGYRPISQQVTLADGAVITRDFVLAVNPLRLGEVVVTGAGTVSTRERLGNVINSVDSSLIRRQTQP